MTLKPAARLRRSCARPFAIHACHTASSSGFTGGGSRTFRNSCSTTEVGISISLSSPFRGAPPLAIARLAPISLSVKRIEPTRSTVIYEPDLKGGSRWQVTIYGHLTTGGQTSFARNPSLRNMAFQCRRRHSEVRTRLVRVLPAELDHAPLLDPTDDRQYARRSACIACESADGQVQPMHELAQ
jgi:hypothetical protein